MVTKGAFPHKVDSSLDGFAHALKSAVCEWLLLFLLLLDAAFSFLLTKIAQYCELQLPCILCSRLDHILGKEKPDFYRNLLCHNHKSEISSLVSCHNHGNLGDVHGMCEECLLSFAKNESSEEIYKLLVGKLGSDCFQKPLLSLDIGSVSLTTKYCSCCSKTWRSRPNVQKLIQSKPSPSSSKLESPLPKSPANRGLNHQEGLKKKDRLSLATTSPDLDSLSHVGYTEVKISSDSESDYLFSDDDEIITMPRNRKKLSNLMFSNLGPGKGESTTPKFVVKKSSPASEIGSLDDIPLSSSVPKGSPTTSADGDGRVSMSKKFGASGFSDFISHKTVLAPKSVQQPAKLIKQKHIETKDIGDLQHASLNNWESIDLYSTSTDPIRKYSPLSNNSPVIGARDLASSSIKNVKTLFAEQLAKRLRLEEQTGSNLADPQTDSSTINISSTVNGQKTLSPRSVESQMKTRSPSIARSQSLEFIEEIVSGIEAESLVDRLRRQVKYDKKRIKSLQRELEEERNAAEIAVSQAMAMITKLQEEKSSFNMERSETLQYLRMMEEQSEYDVEALERANDMIAEKEKEIQDLENELDFFRIKYADDFPEMNEEIMFAEDDDPQGSYIERVEVEK